MISQSQALSWKNFWSLTFPSYNTKYLNHIRSIMINSALIPHGVLLWWQRKTWKSVAHPSDLFFSNNNGFQVLMCHHAVRKDTHAGLQRILRHAMNYGCGSAIVTWIQASKHKNITILNTWIYQHNITIPSVILKELVVCGGCNEWRLLIRHRAVRKDTHADLQQLLSADAPLACKELPMLWHRSAVGKQTVTHQLWRTKSGDSNNLPLLFDATWLLVAPRCASKIHDPPYLFYNPLKQSNIGCNRGSKIEKKGSQY